MARLMVLTYLLSSLLPNQEPETQRYMEYNTWQILILILTFNCRSSCLSPKLLCPPSLRGTAEEVPAVPPASEAGWFLSRSALCLARGCLSRRAEAATSSQSSCGQCCARLALTASAHPLHWIRRKCVSKVELLRKHQAEHAGRTGRASCAPQDRQMM